MRKAVTPKKVVHYVFVITALWLSYRCYVSYQNSQQDGRHKAYGPRDIGRGQQDIRIEVNEDHGAPSLRRGPVDLDDRLQQLQENQGSPEHGPEGHHRKSEDNKDRQKLYPDGQRKPSKKGVLNKDDKVGVRKSGSHEARREGKDVRAEGRGRGRRGDEDGGGHGDKKLRFDGGGGAREVIDGPARKKDKKVDTFEVEPKIDWALEEELQQRRKKFMEEVAKRAETYDPEQFQNMHELDDHLAFITAATQDTWAGLQQFVYSVQYFYPHSDIGIYDLGLSEAQRVQLQTYCRVSVIPTYMSFWPKHLTDTNRGLWRPMIWQMGLANYGHIVYVEPERFLHAKNMKNYIEHSRRAGITVVGRKLPYSPFVVTHPEMYHFLSVDTRKLQRVSMFDLSMIIIHNSEPIRHEFMRYLLACALEEYCIAPPGSRPDCDHRFYPGSKKYANCHRYEMSAVNILLDRWFQFKQDVFLVRDIATTHYDGSDVSGKIKVCDKAQNKNEDSDDGRLKESL